MTITMTAKHQITIPSKITNVLGLRQGAIFSVEIVRNRIELIPLEVKPKVFTQEQYKKLDALSKREHGKEKKVTPEFIYNLKKGRNAILS